jgi:hypothetical protein
MATVEQIPLPRVSDLAGASGGGTDLATVAYVAPFQDDTSGSPDRSAWLRVGQGAVQRLLSRGVAEAGIPALQAEADGTLRVAYGPSGAPGSSLEIRLVTLSPDVESRPQLGHLVAGTDALSVQLSRLDDGEPVLLYAAGTAGLVQVRGLDDPPWRFTVPVLDAPIAPAGGIQGSAGLDRIPLGAAGRLGLVECHATPAGLERVLRPVDGRGRPLGPGVSLGVQGDLSRQRSHGLGAPIPDCGPTSVVALGDHLFVSQVSRGQTWLGPWTCGDRVNLEGP